MAEKGFVLDCSVALSWFFEDEQEGEPVQDLLNDHIAYAPSLLTIELLSALNAALKRERIELNSIAEIIKDFRRLPIKIVEIDCLSISSELLSLASTQHLSIYDSLYLELSISRKLPLATLDKKLRNAAKSFEIKVIPEL